ncbi:hypothetical protein AGMMS4952_13410 [Spirochaetia bacterium]|nr:hypothetical protein AGMMS4952_13410 [Spirochaetia bacterium]
MRASIPALFILMIMVSEKIETCKKTTANFVLLLVFLIGSITPLHEMTRTVVNTYRKSNVDVFSEEFIMTYPNFMGDSQKFFFKYIAK